MLCFYLDAELSTGILAAGHDIGFELGFHYVAKGSFIRVWMILDGSRDSRELETDAISIMEVL